MWTGPQSGSRCRLDPWGLRPSLCRKATQPRAVSRSSAHGPGLCMPRRHDWGAWAGGTGAGGRKGEAQRRRRKREVKSSEVGAGQDFRSPGLSFLVWKVEIIIPPNAKGYREHSMSQCSRKCSGINAKARQETSSMEASLIVSDLNAALSWGFPEPMVQPSVPAL